MLLSSGLKQEWRKMVQMGTSETIDMLPIRVTSIARLPPRMTSFWIISSPISSNFLSNSPFSPSPAGRLGQLKPPWYHNKLSKYILMIKVQALTTQMHKFNSNSIAKQKPIQNYKVRCKAGWEGGGWHQRKLKWSPAWWPRSSPPLSRSLIIIFT